MFAHWYLNNIIIEQINHQHRHRHKTNKQTKKPTNKANENEKKSWPIYLNGRHVFHYINLLFRSWTKKKNRARIELASVFLSIWSLKKNVINELIIVCSLVYVCCCCWSFVLCKRLSWCRLKRKNIHSKSSELSIIIICLKKWEGRKKISNTRKFLFLYHWSCVRKKK